MKQKIKKVFSGIFVLILMVTMLPVGTKASEIEVIDDYTKVPSCIWREGYDKREYGVSGYSGVQGPLSIMRVYDYSRNMNVLYFLFKLCCLPKNNNNL